MPTIPKPFQRPSISLDHQEREWRDIRADLLLPDDIVVDRGLVVDVTPSRSATKVTAVTFQSGITVMFGNHSVQRAFVKVDA